MGRSTTSFASHVHESVEGWTKFRHDLSPCCFRRNGPPGAPGCSSVSHRRRSSSTSSAAIPAAAITPVVVAAGPAGQSYTKMSDLLLQFISRQSLTAVKITHQIRRCCELALSGSHQKRETGIILSNRPTSNELHPKHHMQQRREPWRTHVCRIVMSQAAAADRLCT